MQANKSFDKSNKTLENKLSFIIIGKNQENTITKCLNSVLSTCEYNSIDNYELIYVDSNSTDQTINIIKKHFKLVKIVKLTGKFNAAIGRNTGAKISSGNVIFFIDGDMEINKNFLKKVYSKENGLMKNIISGKVQDYFYSHSWDGVILINDDRFGIKKDSYQSFLGGIFIIKRNLFFENGGFTNYLKENEDKDFALKLSIKGHYIYYLNMHIARHHTIDYNHFSRLLKRFINGNMFYPSIIFRKYFHNKIYLKSFFNLQKFSIILVLSIILGFTINIAFIFLYPLFIVAKNLTKQKSSLIEDLVGTFLANVSFILGIFLFHPCEIDDSNITFEIIH